LPYSLDFGENFGSKNLIPVENFKAGLADNIFDAMKFDKKFSASANKFILLKGINRPVVFHNVEAKIIKEAIIKNITIKI
jgi:3-dehydroquinate synthetase